MSTTSWETCSPDGHVVISVTLDSGKLFYEVRRDGAQVISTSRMGIDRDDRCFSRELGLVDAPPPVAVNEAYRMLHGKQLEMFNSASERTLQLANADGERFDVIVRAYDDGVAFRYRFSSESAILRTVVAEATTFRIAAPGSAWLQPTQDPAVEGPSYEELHSNVETGAASPGVAWNLPALFQVGDRFALISESDLDGSYFGGHLGADPIGLEYQLVLPHPLEGNGIGPSEPTSTSPWTMPWRFIVVADTLTGIVETNLATHLSRQCEVEETDWIKPGRVSWSWWSDFDSPQDLSKLCDYIDLSHEMGWEHSLIDANWDVHEESELHALIEYAGAKDVAVSVWYNSGGEHNLVAEGPRDLMLDSSVRRTEMERIVAMGVTGIKVDFFHSDKQLGIQLMEDILKDAADFKLMVNFHGCTIPRGWTRRWPHLMSVEAVPGAEQYYFRKDYPMAAPANNTILPFTRNVIGPMDYTPVTFGDQRYAHLTTATHELALTVVFESALHHFADSAVSYRAQPAAVRRFLSAVPSTWDETRLVSGWPGLYVVMARRSGATWYVAGINGELNPREIAVDARFLDMVAPSLEIGDGVNRDDYTISVGEFDPRQRLTKTMVPNGGFVMRIG